MRYCVHETEVPTAGEDGADVRRLFAPDRGCEMFEQRVLGVGREGANVGAASADELLFVLSGAGTLVADGATHALAKGAGAVVPAGTRGRVTGELELLSVLVLDPEEPTGEGTVVVDLHGADPGGATSGRQFRLGVTPDTGCRSATQFLGIIPPGRAPDHFHRYDEVVYVLSGEGALHIGGETAPLRRGSCVHLPARLVHCLENSGEGEMTVLGVFRPAGSPAEAYYPDGTLAAVPAEE